jgi:hypothetical protein
MTDEQINAAIAEACGWEAVCVDGGSGYYKGFDNGAELRPDLPDYCTDLNAMHEAEKVLTKEQVREYQTYMYDMACKIDNTCGRWMPYSATAAYRAEAFLRTLGKWEEAE